ncbi:HNH endonuclease [Paenibacillus polysaccharolyticus]|uniref:HNH endonuclease n=1 Tax=Paenibacillus polysaccharolyticus TaxID=582692 RepID=UPI003570DFA8
METGSAPFREGKTAHETRQTKTCMHCGERRPASEFRRRTGRRASSGARRGACRRCRQLGVREQHNRDMRVAQASPSAKLERRGQDGMDSDLREDMVSSLVKNERERNERIALQGSAAGKEQGRDLGKHVNSHAEAGAVLIDQMEKDVAIVSVSDTPSQRKKRRRRRKKKPSEVIHAHASVQAESESEASTDLYAVDRRLPGGELPPGDVHSPGVAAANGKGSAQRARKRAAAVVPAAEQASAAQALLPATPQGPAAGPAPVAADEPPAARRKRKRRRKLAAALAPGAGQARSGAAEAHAPEPGLARDEASTGKASSAAKAQPAAAGREPSHASRSHGAGMDGRPRRHHAPPAAIDPEDPASLRTNRQGMVRMRGKTDKGRRWHQEVDMELAVTLVKEKAAVVINRYTIRRLFSNKDFKRFILDRDKYTCYFCGSYGDTIDHLLPRAKGGHTTPLNCVCACNLCNQSKAAMDADEFMRSGIPEWNAAHQAELLALEIQETGLE